MKNNKDFAKVLALLVIVVVSICAVFGAVFGFLNYRKTYSAKADTIDYNATFTGSPLLFNGFLTDLSWADSLLNNTTFKFGGSGGYGDNQYWYDGIYRNDISLSFHLFYVSGNIACSLNSSYYVPSDGIYAESLTFYSENDTSGVEEDYYILHSYTGSTFDYSTFNPLTYVFSSVYHLGNLNIDTDGIGQFAGFVIGDFDISTVTGFNLWSYREVEQEDFYNIVYCLQYFDSHNNSVVLCYYTAFFDDLQDSPDEEILFNLPYRRYFFISALDISGNLQYEIGYNDGWLDRGDTNYWNGYDNGYNAGQSYGYNKGVAESNNYSFLGLIGAVVDAPVQAFTGLLNFDLLGFNMLSFFTGLLTLALILWVIGKVLGNK